MNSTVRPAPLTRLLRLCVPLLLALPAPALAAWPTQGLLVAGGPGIQSWPLVVEDGSGGALVSWVDFAAGGVYLQRYTVEGDVAAGWPPGGTWVGAVYITPGGWVEDHALASDGAGGAYVLWHNRVADSSGDILLARVAGNGELAAGWPASGVRVSTYPGNERSGTLLADGAGGVFAGWIDRQSGYAYHARVQHYLADASLAPGWPAVAPSSSDGLAYQERPTLARGSSGAVWMAWTIQSAQFLNDRRTRLFLSDGTRSPAFPVGGFLLDQTLLWPAGTGLVADGSGGVVTLGYQHALRLTAQGTAAAGWPAGGIEYLTGAEDYEPHAASVTDGAGGAITAWLEYDTNTQRYATFMLRFDGGGAIASGWPAEGVNLGPASRPLPPHLVPDGSGGAIAAWTDSAGPGMLTDLRARQISADGTPSPLGVIAVCTAPGTQRDFDLAGDDSGGAFFAWVDERDDGGDIYLRLIPKGDLTVGVPAPAAGGPSLRLGRPLPNPSKGVVQLECVLGEDATVEAFVHDVTGRLLCRLLAGERLNAGRHRLVWDGTDEAGHRVAPGLFLISVRAGAASVTARVLRIQ